MENINGKFSSMDSAIDHVRSFNINTGDVLIVEYRGDFEVMPFDNPGDIREWMKTNVIDVKHGDHYAIMRNKTVMIISK